MSSDTSSSATPTLTLTYGPQMVGAAVSMLALTNMAVLLRFYVRIRMLKTFGKDDWLLLVAQLMFIVVCSQAMWNGIVAMADIPILEKLPAIGTTMISIPVSYFVTQIFIKLSLATFYYPIMNKQWQRILVWATVTYFVLFSIAFIFVNLFHCGPPAWQHSIEYSILHDPTLKCISTTDYIRLTWVSVISNCLTDWILVIPPVYTVMHIQLRPAAKLATSGVVLIGIMGSIVSVIRIPYTAQAGSATISGPEKVHASVGFSIASFVEPGLCIIAASLAAMRPLLTKFLTAFFGSTHHRSGASTTAMRSLHSRKPVQHGSMTTVGRAQAGAETPDLPDGHPLEKVDMEKYIVEQHVVEQHVETSPA